MMQLFKTGNIRFKSGSKATYVYTITNRQALKQKFVPYYKKYVCPYACDTKRHTFELLCQILDLFEQKVHLQSQGLAFRILPLVYQMNSEKRQTTKMEVRIFTSSNSPFIICGSSETIRHPIGQN